jgi:hypothetical protein
MRISVSPIITFLTLSQHMPRAPHQPEWTSPRQWINGKAFQAGFLVEKLRFLVIDANNNSVELNSTKLNNSFELFIFCPFLILPRNYQ